MPSYVSDSGVFHPAKERAALTRVLPDGTTEPYIYEGPDRAACFEIWNQDKTGNTTTMGIDFHDDPEMINRAK